MKYSPKILYRYDILPRFDQRSMPANVTVSLYP